MKKEEIPQDPSALEKLTKEVSYAIDEKGNYTTSLSTGWEVKAKALDVAWSDIEKRLNDAIKKVHNHEASPLLYFIELKLMDLSIVSSYTGFWKWQIKRHLKPGVFKKLSDKKLKKYAEVFEVSVEELKTMKGHEA
ncbi:MAG: hypothetical protein ABUT20_02575 [Bacteroidota bacterium]